LWEQSAGVSFDVGCVIVVTVAGVCIFVFQYTVSVDFSLEAAMGIPRYWTDTF
jgi:hypothetical protein